MANIHATALVDPSVKLGAKVEIGPFCVIGPGVELGDGVVVHPHAVITGRTSLGAECKVFPFACLGKAPQDIKYHDEPSAHHRGRQDHHPRARHHQSRHHQRPHGDQGRLRLLPDDRRPHRPRLRDRQQRDPGERRDARRACIDRRRRHRRRAFCRASIRAHRRLRLHRRHVGHQRPTSFPTAWRSATAPRSAASILSALSARASRASRSTSSAKPIALLFASEGTLKERLEDVDGMFRHQPACQTGHRVHQDPVRPLVLRAQQCRNTEQMTATGDKSDQRERSRVPSGS